jgi:outer membrane lipoprotein carrier protein
MRVFLACLALGSATSARAEAPALDPLMRDVDAKKASLHTLTGEFTQRNRVKLFKQELQNKGRLFFQAPDKLRWEYVAPDPSVLILDGKAATLTMPGAAPQRFDLEHDVTMRTIFDQLLAWLGPGSLRKARDQYELTAAGTSKAPELMLVPRAGSAVARAFTRITLKFDGKTFLVRSIVLVEKNGDEKEITFTRVTPNATLPKDAFR